MNKQVKKTLLTFGTIAALATFGANTSSAFFTVHADDTTSTSSSSSTNQNSETSKIYNYYQKKIDKLEKQITKEQAHLKKHNKFTSKKLTKLVKKEMQDRRDQVDKELGN